MAAHPISCIGFILDGNRRWARERGLPTLEGHRRGAEVLQAASRWVRNRGIPHMVVYAFSTENWQRSNEEVGYLLSLFRDMIESLSDDAKKEHIALRFIGERARFPEDLIHSMVRAEMESPANPDMTLWVCLSYGGRAEIVDAAQKAAAEGEISEEALGKYMWSAGMPDPDLIVRTGGAQRLSNFLLWQSAYSEFFFLEPYWPDFSEELLDGVLSEYRERERRMGK